MMLHFYNDIAFAIFKQQKLLDTYSSKFVDIVHILLWLTKLCSSLPHQPTVLTTLDGYTCSAVFT